MKPSCERRESRAAVLRSGKDGVHGSGVRTRPDEAGAG